MGLLWGKLMTYFIFDKKKPRVPRGVPRRSPLGKSPGGVTGGHPGGLPGGPDDPVYMTEVPCKYHKAQGSARSHKVPEATPRRAASEFTRFHKLAIL